MASGGIVHKQDTLAALGTAGDRLVALVRSLSLSDGRQPVPCLGWTVADTAAHVVNVAGRLLGDRRRSTTPEDTQRLNQVCLDELAERDLGSLADRLEVDLDLVVRRVYPKVDFERQYPFHAATTISGGGGAAFFLCELLVHGYDIALATQRDWEILAPGAQIAVRGPAEFWTTLFEPEGWLALRVDVGEFPPVTFPVRPGTIAEVESPVRAAPVELLLAELGRTTPADPCLAAVLAALPQP